MTIEFKGWAKPITFENVDLSPIAIVLDHLGMYGNLPDISEEASLWLWNFTICKGVLKSDSAQHIRQNATQVLKLIQKHRPHLLENAREHFDGPFTEEHIDLWVGDLEKILQLSQNKKRCSWTCKMTS